MTNQATRTAAVQSLSPGYFPFVMATSIISTGTFSLGPSWLSRTLLVIASAGLLLARTHDSAVDDVNGTWLLWVVATQSLSVVASTRAWAASAAPATTTA